ncbi:hypothetical protein D9756_011404 [Leucocoprinus leucothites]|uniref:Amino acid permease/ SLC12A domain-containing protein n=1 Tax=Leucocoprinus leucothites TaxID=201217 RepID=A0A8H5CMU8_9AGAR|nr:hypothetical protein D9756_011404 [Leucoagaricus leucothites]
MMTSESYGAISGAQVLSPAEQSDVLPAPPVDKDNERLHRGLSARQVQMIAVAGTIGTGLFLGTGSSLATGGPASMLICYTIIGFIVYITLLLLGEMATQYPIAGSFGTYCTRFFSPSYGFALAWNYWFNDAVSVAGHLVAAQLVMAYWTNWHPWTIGLIFWFFLVGVNAVHVKVYGELEYWLASLKVIAIIMFIILGILVNVGINSEHRFIGGEYWRISGAPFVGGFGGFARVFVTASFAYGGTESLGITAGEMKNPSKNMPRVIKFVFWRDAVTSPFTIVFQQVGTGLSATKQAPRLFSWTTTSGIPLPSLLATSSISILCFGSSYIGNGALWSWLQNLVGVSDQIAWFSIGLASWRFRKAWVIQGRSLDDMKFRVAWTWPWGPAFVPIDFVSYYIKIPVMIVMCIFWMLIQRPGLQASTETSQIKRLWYNDLVDISTVDLQWLKKLSQCFRILDIFANTRADIWPIILKIFTQVS